MKIFLSRLLLSAVLLIASTAQAAPQIPPLSGRVVDAGSLLSPATKQQLTQKLASHENSTSNQVAVLTVPNLQGYDIASFALEVARTWQLGQKDLNNGVLLLVAKDERKIRIEVGYGLEGDLTDAQSKRIIQSVIRPAFKQSDFDRGISAGVEAIVGTIDGSYTPPERKASRLDTPLIPLGILGLFGFANFLQGRVHKKYINALMGGSFGGTMVGLATNKWYFGVLAALALGTLFYRSRSGNRSGISGGQMGHNNYGNGRFGSGGFGGGSGGGFGGGGGGGFGGGGASGGW